MGPKVKAKKFPDGEVTGLEPGKKYEFRVRAENKAGLGEPSESTNPHLMKVSGKQHLIKLEMQMTQITYIFFSGTTGRSLSMSLQWWSVTLRIYS